MNADVEKRMARRNMTFKDERAREWFGKLTPSRQNRILREKECGPGTGILERIRALDIRSGQIHDQIEALADEIDKDRRMSPKTRRKATRALEQKGSELDERLDAEYSGNNPAC